MNSLSIAVFVVMVTITLSKPSMINRHKRQAYQSAGASTYNAGSAYDPALYDPNSIYNSAGNAYGAGYGGNQQQAYGGAQAAYGGNQAAYGGNRAAYGGAQAAYGGGQPAYGNQAAYGGNPNAYGR